METVFLLPVGLEPEMRSRMSGDACSESARMRSVADL